MSDQIHRMIIENRDIDSDSINTIGQLDLAKDIEALLKQSNLEILDRLLEKLPEEYDNYTGTSMEDYQKGHNDTVEEIKAIIEDLKINIK